MCLRGTRSDARVSKHQFGRFATEPHLWHGGDLSHKRIPWRVGRCSTEIQLPDALQSYPDVSHQRSLCGTMTRIHFSLLTQRLTISHKVPPIVLDLVSRNVGDFDMSSVTEVFTGAAPLDAQVAWVLLMLYPRWKIRQAYGMTAL